MNIAEWLNKKMEERGLTPTSLAALINENQETIFRISKGVTPNPRTKILKSFEKFFSFILKYYTNMY